MFHFILKLFLRKDIYFTMIKKNVTMSDIAKAMNVSTVTVSKALGDREGVSEALRERIKQKASEMGYRIHSGARSSSNGLNYNIGIIVAKRFISEPSTLYWVLYKQLVELLQKQNYYGILEVVEDGSDSEIPPSIRDGKVDGMILLGQFSDNYIDKLLSFYIPAVFLDFQGSRDDVDVVLSDSFYGAYRLTSHLITNGHRRIGFVGNFNNVSSIRDRYLGFYKALLENYLTLHSEWIIPDRTDGGELFGSYELPSELPTAFVCCSDETAYKLVNQLNGMGVKIPDEISIVGYENHTYSTMCNPHLTTMDVNTSVMASEAVNIVLHKIRDRTCSGSRTLIAGKLVRRDSVRNLFA